MKTSLFSILVLIIIYIGVFFFINKSSTKPSTQLVISSEWNAAQAQKDIKNGEVKILFSGLPMPCLNYDKLTIKYGFRFEELGCTPPLGEDFTGINEYNTIVNAYLTKLNGQEWENKLNVEIDSAAKHNPCFN